MEPYLRTKSTLSWQFNIRPKKSSNQSRVRYPFKVSLWARVYSSICVRVGQKGICSLWPNISFKHWVFLISDISRTFLIVSSIRVSKSSDFKYTSIWAIRNFNCLFTASASPPAQFKNLITSPIMTWARSFLLASEDSSSWLMLNMSIMSGLRIIHSEARLGSCKEGIELWASLIIKSKFTESPNFKLAPKTTPR